MLEIFLLLLPLFAMIATGYLVGILKIADHSWVKVLNLFGYYIAFPALIFTSLAKAEIDLSVHTTIIIVQLLIAVGLMGGTYIITRLLKLSRENQNTFIIGIYFANTGYIGIPALEIVFGQEAAASGAVIVAMMILATFTLGVGMLEKSKSHIVNIRNIIVGIIKNPLIWSALLGLTVSVGNIPLFQTIERYITFMAGAASPAVLVALGIFLATNHPKKSTIKISILLTAIKMLAVPAIFTIILLCVGNRDWLDVTYIQSSMPIAITAFAFAEIYPMNKPVVSTSILFSTLSAVILLPLIMWLTTVI